VKALARSALTEVATALSRLVSSGCEYLFACEHPSLHTKKIFVEGFWGAIHFFSISIFFFSRKRKNLSFGILLS